MPILNNTFANFENADDLAQNGLISPNLTIGEDIDLSNKGDRQEKKIFMMDLSQSNFLIQSLAGFSAKIHKLIQLAAEEKLLWQPESNEWNIQMTLTHLLHCEPHFQKRLDGIIKEVNPYLPYFGPEQATPYSNQNCEQLLGAFAKARKQTLNQIYAYHPEDWIRPAIHETQGETTLKEQIMVIVHHDLEHLGQIYDIIELWQAKF